MVTMGLDIGGAETHILELSKELNSRGFEVLIASNGGVYVEELERCGVRHIQLPLHAKNPRAVIQSYSGLKNLIRQEKPDIVHAHARIPAFITGLVRCSVPFCFVTTAHWVFNVTPVNRILTNWGTYTIAVSDDIRQYLIDEYDLRPDQISITINGIDMEKFSPELTGDRIFEEFNMDSAAPTVAYVSRMDESRAFVAGQLIEIAPRLAEKIPGIQLLIAGGGDRFDELFARSQEQNRKIGRNCIVMTGARTDINEIVAAGDIFVGVSRAALEAMSAGKPSIIAGNEGYIGIFGEEKLEISQLTNFCCRGCEMSDEERLFRDVAALMEMNPEDRAAVGDYGRETVRKYYSAARMTDDYVRVYEKAVLPRCNLLISGYYGYGNAGDEVILHSIYENVMGLGGNTAIDVLVADPEKNKGRYPFRMVDRFRFRDMRKAVRSCDVLISGGGSLLQDSTSTKSLLYYTMVMNLAKHYGKKLVVYANGIGPVAKEGNRKRVRKAVEKADLITLRDERSRDELLQMGVQDREMHITADPVFAYKGAEKYREQEKAEQLLKRLGLPGYKKFVGVSVRAWQALDPGFENKIASLCDWIHREYGLKTVFILMQDSLDREISERIRSLMESDSYVIEYGNRENQLMGVTGSARFMISMRLHTLIFAANMGVPTLGLVYDHKVSEYLSILGMPSAGSVEHLDEDKTAEAVRLLMDNYDNYTQQLHEKTEQLCISAERNTELLKDFLQELGQR